MTALLYLVGQFNDITWLTTFYSTLAALLLIFAIYSISILNRLVVIVLITIGTTIFFTEGASLQTSIQGFGQNISLLALFVLIPLIGTFMSTAGYLSALKEKVIEREQYGGKHPYRLSYILVATIGTLLNFGTLAIVKRIADESFSSFKERKLMLHMMRAFAFCMLWSPYFVNVGLVLVLFDVSWFDIGLFGFIFALIYMGISVVMLPRISFKDDPNVNSPVKTKKFKQKKLSLIPFITFSTVLISFSLILDYILEVNMLTVVSLTAVVLPLIWSVFFGLFKEFVQEVYGQVLISFLKFKNELAIFISAGYFGVAISLTDLGEVISAMLFTFSLGSVYLFTLFIIIITIFMAQIGVHPIIIVIGIGSALSPQTFGVSSEYLALTLLLAWTLATQVSPFSGQMLMVSQLIRTPAGTIAKQNAFFIFVCFLILPFVLFIFHKLQLLTF